MQLDPRGPTRLVVLEHAPVSNPEWHQAAFLGLSQYGLRHFGQRRGCSAFLGVHSVPQRRQVRTGSTKALLMAWMVTIRTVCVKSFLPYI